MPMAVQAQFKKLLPNQQPSPSTQLQQQSCVMEVQAM
jgi:hypothetical protein